MASRLFARYPLLAPAAACALLVLLPFWKLALMQGVVITNDIFTSDLMNDGLPYRHYLGSAIGHGEFPLWYPGIFGGIPLLARAEAGTCYPLNLLLFPLMPTPVALNIVMLATLMIAAAGMYAYGKIIGMSVEGALCAAASYAYCGFMMAHMKHLSMVNAACWFPLGLYLIEHAAQAWKRGEALGAMRALVWLAVVFGMQILSGHIQIAYYAGLVYGGYGLARLLHDHQAGEAHGGRQRRNSVGAALALLLGSLILGTTLGAAQLLPTYEMVQQSQRSGGVTFDYAADYRYAPSDAIMFLAPYANGDIGDGTYRSKAVFWEDYGYAGLLPFLLGVYALFRGWKGWHVRALAVTGVVCYLMVLGPNTPLFEGAFTVIPGMKFFRFPTRFLFVVDACIAALGGIGVTMVLKSVARRSSNASIVPAVGTILLAVTVADLLYSQLRQNPIVDAHAWFTPPRTAAALQSDTSIFRIYSPGAKEKHNGVFALSRGWEGDLQRYVDHREFLQPSLNVLFNLSSADGYAQLTPRAVVDIWGDQNRSGDILKTASLVGNVFVPQPSFHTIMDLFNVKYILAAWPIGDSSFIPLGTFPGGVHAYRNPRVLPRAFIVSMYRHAASEEEARMILVGPDFSPAREAILFDKPSISLSTPDSAAVAHIEHYSANRVIVHTSAAGPALLVLSDTYYPGWEADIDGVPASILQANLCQRAVVVPAGEQTVTFRFAPGSVAWGAGITGIGVVLAGAGWVITRRKRG
jgi:hypothetical protein